MPLLPETVCPRCHRKYPSLRSRCPYCGTKRIRETRSPVPESDTAVRGSEAARRSAENLNWQTLIGGFLLLAVVIAMISVISVNMKTRVEATEAVAAEERRMEAPDVDLETTPIPVPTPVPTPTPTPPPAVTSIQITCYDRDIEDFMEPQGAQIQLSATWYPATVDATVVWTSSDESVATVDDTGLVTVQSDSGSCTIYATVGSVYDTCGVFAR